MDCIHQPEVPRGLATPSPAAPSLADRTALAIDDALTHEASRAGQAELRSKNERLKLLLDLNNAIVSNLDLRDLLRAIASSVRQVMKCDSVGVALLDPDDQRLRIHAVDFPEGKGLIREESKVPSADGPRPAARSARARRSPSMRTRWPAWMLATWPSPKASGRCVTFPSRAGTVLSESCAWAGCTTVLSPGTKSSSYARWQRRLLSPWRMPWPTVRLPISKTTWRKRSSTWKTRSVAR